MIPPRRPVGLAADAAAQPADWARKQLYSYPGYVRVPNPDRLQNGRAGESGRKGSYKKGWELRLVVPVDELEDVRTLITEAGLPLAKPFLKGRQLIQPIYGYRPVVEYLEATGASAEVLRAKRVWNGDSTPTGDGKSASSRPAAE